MRIFVACISLALVAGIRAHCSHAKSNNLRLFGIDGYGRMVRSGAGGGSNGVSGFYIPASSVSSSGGSNRFQSWSAGANQGSSGIVNTFNLPGSIGGGSTFSLSAGSYNSAASGAGRAANSNSQGWTPILGAGTSGLPSSNRGGASYGLSVVNAGAGGYGNPSATVGAGGLGNQLGHGGDSGSNYLGWMSNQGESGGTVGSDFQSWNSNKGSNGGAGVYSLPGPIASTGFSDQVGSAGAGSYGLPSASVDATKISNLDGNGLIGSFQSYSGRYSGASGQGGKRGVDGGRFQRYDANADNSGNLDGKGTASGSKSSSQSASAGPNNSNMIGRGAGGHSLQSSNLGDYQEIPVSFQTSEGRNVDPQLLEQIRTILYEEEASSGSSGGYAQSASVPSMSYGAPSSTYGAPSRSNRVVGVVLEGINQSIQIAQFHQRSSALSGPSLSMNTLAVPTGMYGAH